MPEPLCFPVNQYQIAKQSFLFLKKFFEHFPELKENNFYIGGVSYAGKYVPALAKEIIDHIDVASQFFTFKGIILENSAVDSYLQSGKNFIYNKS